MINLFTLPKTPYRVLFVLAHKYSHKRDKNTLRCKWTDFHLLHSLSRSLASSWQLHSSRSFLRSSEGSSLGVRTFIGPTSYTGCSFLFQDCKLALFANWITPMSAPLRLAHLRKPACRSCRSSDSRLFPLEMGWTLLQPSLLLSRLCHPFLCETQWGVLSTLPNASLPCAMETE